MTKLNYYARAKLNHYARTQAAIRKVMFDQQQKVQGLPTRYYVSFDTVVGLF